MRLILYAISLLTIVSCSNHLTDNKHFQTYKDTLFTEQFRCSKGWIAGDGAYSISLLEKKSLWLFGDSYMDCLDSVTNTVPCLFQARNAAMIMDNLNLEFTTLKNSGEASFFVSGNDRKYWFWPGSGFMNGDTVYVFLSRLKSTGEPGMWGFAGVDTNYVAKMHLSDLSEVTYHILPSAHGITFGVSTIKDGKFTLIYGIRSNGFGNDLFLARFPTENLYSKWQYFDGSVWSDRIEEIKKIHSEFTASFNLCKIKNRFVLITTEFSVGCDQGKKIFVADSKNPYGPFNSQHPVWEVDDTLGGHFPFFYMANAHPEYDNGKNELLVTYCINGYGDCVSTCIGGRLSPDVYRPKAIRVPFSILY